MLEERTDVLFITIFKLKNIPTDLRLFQVYCFTLR